MEYHQRPYYSLNYHVQQFWKKNKHDNIYKSEALQSNIGQTNIKTCKCQNLLRDSKGAVVFAEFRKGMCFKTIK